MLVCVLDPRALTMAHDFRACAVEPEGSGIKNDFSVVLAGYGSHVRERAVGTK